MSGVYERNRSISQYEFFHKALQIRVEVCKLAHTVIPKAYRFTFAAPLAETARSIVANINRADAFYPNTSINVLERRRYLTLAIADCEQVMLDFQCMLELGLPIKHERLEALIDDVESEISLLKGARKNVRLTGKESVEDRKKSLREELSRLDGIQ